jgi:hypothetical protein
MARRRIEIMAANRALRRASKVLCHRGWPMAAILIDTILKPVPKRRGKE